MSGVFAEHSESAAQSVFKSRSKVLAWVGLWGAGLLAVFMFWGFDALPFQDLPAHAGLIAMRHRFASSLFESRFFVLAPHIGPYSLFRFLGEAFVRVAGPVGAVRALATLPMVVTPLALIYARRRLHGDMSPTYGYIGLALSFGFMTLLGFASYLLGVAVMLFGLVFWLELLAAADDNAPDLARRELVVMGFAPLIFVAHGHAFILFLLCAGVSVLSTGFHKTRFIRLRTLIPALGLAAWVAWIERSSQSPPGTVPVVPPLTPLFHGPWAKFELFLTPTLMTRTGIDAFVGVVFWGFAVVSCAYTVRFIHGRGHGQWRPAVAGSHTPASHALAHCRALYACAGAILVLFLFLPHAIGWFGFVDGRLVPVVLMMALLGVHWTALPQRLARMASVFARASAWLLAALSVGASFFFQREAHGYEQVLARVPAEATLLNLPVDPNSDIFTGHPFIHYDKLVLAVRPVVVSDVWFHQGSALYPTPLNPSLRLPASYSESDLKFIDWPAYHLEDWQFVLIRTRPGAEMPVVPAVLTLDEHVGGWWLFKHAPAMILPR